MLYNPRKYFEETLKEGEKYEQVVNDYLIEKNWFPIKDNKDGDYDLLMISNNNKEFKIEIKTDFKAHKTGNIVIEFQSGGKPSGIATTKSDLFIIIIPGLNKMLFIITNYLKKIIDEYNPEKNTSVECWWVVNGGDTLRKNNLMYAWKLKTLIKLLGKNVKVVSMKKGVTI